jgi:hypothetical protein
MTPHTVFLRTGCILPNGVELPQEPVGQGWNMVKELLASVLDRKIRAVGWHFMWLHNSSSRRGLGRTDEEAIRSALTSALGKVAPRFNAAELDSLKVSHYPGFRVAKVELHARQVQRNSSLDPIDTIGG